MHHDKVSAKGKSPHQLLMKCLDRTRPQHWLLSGKIDQIVCVNDEWAEPKLCPANSKSSRVAIRNARRTACPGARTSGKDLQGVASELLRRIEGIQEVASNRSVNTDTQAAIHPGRCLRFRLRFGSVLVFRVELSV